MSLDTLSIHPTGRQALKSRTGGVKGVKPYYIISVPDFGPEQKIVFVKLFGRCDWRFKYEETTCNVNQNPVLNSSHLTLARV